MPDNDAIIAPKTEVVQEPAKTQEVEAKEAKEVTEEGSEQQESQDHKVKGGFQRKIDKLTREKYDAIRRVEYLESLVGKPKEEAKPAPKAEEAKKPNINDYEDHSQYVEDLAAYRAREIVREAEENREKERQIESARSERTKVAETYNAKELEFAKEHADFQEVAAGVKEDIINSPALLEEVVTHEHGPALAYYLGQNPDEIDRLAQLSPVALARAITRLEPRFVPKEGEKQEIKPAVTRAPRPPSPIARSSSTSTKEPEEMSAAEYREWRKKTGDKNVVGNW